MCFVFAYYWRKIKIELSPSNNYVFAMVKTPADKIWKTKYGFHKFFLTHFIWIEVKSSKGV